MNSIRQELLTIGRWTAGAIRNVSSHHDFWLSWVQSSAIMAVLFLAAAGFFLDRAKPEMNTFFDRHLGKNPRIWWDREMAGTGETLLVVSFVISVLGLFAYRTIHKKRRTRAVWALGIVAVASLVTLIAFESIF
jgi:hypothetical protein